MYKILNDLLSDKKGEIIFNVLGIWHLAYLLIFLFVFIFILLVLKNKDYLIKEKVINITINFAFILYILDFFLMPFSYQYIDIEKLPFHICTITCVLCFLSRHNSFFNKFKYEFAILGLIGNLIYLFYPAGVGWYQIHPLSYRVVQTLLYHFVMSSYGLFTLMYEKPKLEIKKSIRMLIIVIILVVWALLGNTLYNGTYKEYDHFFNWLFVVRDPFYILPIEIAKFIMPIFMIIFLYSLSILVYFIYNKLRRE